MDYQTEITPALIPGTNYMSDITVELNKDETELIIKCKLKKPFVMSKSGKSKVVASSNGNIVTGIIVEDKALVIGINAYIPVK